MGRRCSLLIELTQSGITTKFLLDDLAQCVVDLATDWRNGEKEKKESESLARHLLLLLLLVVVVWKVDTAPYLLCIASAKDFAPVGMTKYS